MRADSKKALIIEEMTVADFERERERTQTVILPLGCTEQHGYHLPLSTDTIIGYEMAKAAAARLGCFVAPVVPYSFSGGELAGTLNVSPHITSLYVRDICRSLAQYGMKKIVALFGHGGSENLRDVKEGLKYFLWQEKAFADVTLAALDVLQPSKTWKKHFANQDYHAALVETAVIMHLRPDLVKDDKPRDVEHIAKMLMEDPDKYQAAIRHTQSEYEIPHISQSEEVKIGVMGDPTDATAEMGRELFEEAIEGLVEIIQKL
ncbi:MAG: creatininase family protein [Planctomycetota bacterium]|nr:creatininase family protein [Planctomycetota bacterium]